MPVNLRDFADKYLTEASQRVATRIKKISEVKKTSFKDIRINSIDTKERSNKFKMRRDKSAELGFERKIGIINDIISIEYLESGIEAAKAVGRIELAGGLEFGTGFFVSPSLVITNYHVLSKERARNATIEMFAEANRIGERRQSQFFYFDPDTFFLHSEDLDFTLIAVENTQSTEKYGWLPLFEEQGKILIGHPVNIIQHPDGKDKMVVTQNSRLLHLDDSAEVENYCWYQADTEKGSSGSPVFNNNWEVIALHHKAVPNTNIHGDILDIKGNIMNKNRFNSHPELINWIANEGIRCSKIVKAIREFDFGDSHKEIEIRDSLLELWSHPKAQRPGKKQGWF